MARCSVPIEENKCLNGTTFTRTFLNKVVKAQWMFVEDDCCMFLVEEMPTFTAPAVIDYGHGQQAELVHKESPYHSSTPPSRPTGKSLHCNSLYTSLKHTQSFLNFFVYFQTLLIMWDIALSAIIEREFRVVAKFD